MWGISKFFQTLESHLSFIQMLRGWIMRIAGGVMTAWAAWATTTMQGYAPLSYVVAFLVGALLVSAIFAVTGWFRVELIKAKIHAKLLKEPSNFDPLESHFHKKRLNISQLSSPINNEINQKSFTKCEILGPADVYIGTGNIITRNRIGNCNFIAVKRGIPLFNVINMVHCSIDDCEVFGINFFVHPDAVRHIPDGHWITERTTQTSHQSEASQSQSRPNTEEETQP